MRFRKCVIAFQFPGSPLYVPSTSKTAPLIPRSQLNFCAILLSLNHARRRRGANVRMRLTALSAKMCHSTDEWRCRDAPCEKSWKQGNPLSNTIKDTSTIIRNPSLHNSDNGVTHDCASIFDSIAKGTSCFHHFSHGASLHRHSFS